MWCLVLSEAEEDEDMAVNIRVGFKERQHKCLSEFITLASPPANKSCVEVLSAAPVPDISFAPKPSTDDAGPNHVPAVRPPLGKDARLKRGRASTGPTPPSDDFVECVAFVLSVPPRP